MELYADNGFESRKKRALVLGGGGSRGSYEIGVWQALREIGWQFDIVTGTSVGSINGAIIAADDFDVAEEVWQQLDTGMVFGVDVDESLDIKSKTALVLKKLAHNMIRTGAGDGEKLRNLLTRYIIEQRVRDSKMEYGLATVDMKSLKLAELVKEEIPEGKLIDYIMASAAIFPAVKPQIINEVTYVDGGLFEQLPMDLAIRCGAQDIIAVELDGEGLLHKNPTDGVRVRLIKSRWDLGSVFVFDRGLIKRNMRLGYLDALKLFSAYDGLYYTFIKGSMSGLFRVRRAKYNAICAACAVSPASVSDGFIERNASATLRKMIKQRGYTNNRYENVMLCAAELCGQIFGLDPTLIYSAESFVGRLEEKVLGYSVEIRKVLKKFKDNRLTPESVKQSLGILSREIRTIVIARMISNNVSSGKPFSLAPVASLQAFEYLAALFIATVINNDVYVSKENRLLGEI